MIQNRGFKDERNIPQKISVNSIHADFSVVKLNEYI
jgi:hypothetical protein